MTRHSEMHGQLPHKALRRLTAAEGYLELEMPVHAMRELDAIEDAGPFAASIELMRGESLKQQQRYADAVAPLQKAAQMIPTPHNKSAWLSLSECFREEGKPELADIVEKFANTPHQLVQNIIPVLDIRITIEQVDPSAEPGEEEELIDPAE